MSLTSKGLHQSAALAFQGPLNCNTGDAWTKPLWSFILMFSPSTTRELVWVSVTRQTWLEVTNRQGMQAMAWPDAVRAL